MIVAGRNDVALARNLRTAAIAEAAADGAIHQAAFHSVPCTEAGCTAWPTDGAPIDASREGISVAVCLTDESGKVNPNKANPALLAALLGAVGVPDPEAMTLADAIAAWHTRNASPAAIADRTAQYRRAGLPFAPDGRNFTDVSDLRFVLGMTPAILDRLRPSLSIWNQADPDPRLATPAIRAALEKLLATDPVSLMNLGPIAMAAGPRALTVTASASVERGARFTRSAVISLERDPSKPPLRILNWSTAPATPCG